MKRRRDVGLGAAVIQLALAATTAAEAQDIEVRAHLMGQTLPAGYFETVRERPDFFEIDRGWTRRTAQATAQRSAVTGVLPLLVINALFSDSPPPTVSEVDIQQSLFDGPNPDGTVQQFYTEVSGGRFTVSGMSVPWVQTSLTRDTVVGMNFGLGSDALTGPFLVEALTGADSLLDFGQFDNDGPDGIPNSGDDDGFVDAVAFHFSEIAASCGGNGIWPHRSRIQNWTGSAYASSDVRPDSQPIFVDSYIIQSAVTCDGSAVAKASTIAHELGHVLGLPDYYDSTEGILPEQRRWVLGCWSLMAAGAWGCGTVDRNSVDRPTHMAAWEKIQLGWATEQLVDSVLDSTLTLQPIQVGETVLRIPLSSNEFLLAEYRTQTGFDQGLPASGVLIYHIDPQLPLRPCLACRKVYQVALVEADGDSTLIKNAAQGGNRGEPEDAFALAGPERLTNGTNPTLRLNEGPNAPVMIHRIAVENGVANLTISTISIPASSLLESFLQNGAAPLNQAQQDFLDLFGNQNGRYDVGDLRAFLGDNPVN